MDPCVPEAILHRTFRCFTAKHRVVSSVRRSERLARIVGKGEASYKCGALSFWKGAEGCGAVSRQIICN